MWARAFAATGERAAPSALSGQAHEAVDVNEIGGAEYHGRDERRPNELREQARNRRRPGIGPMRDVALLMLRSHAPGQHGEQHHPPNDEIDRESARD